MDSKIECQYYNVEDMAKLQGQVVAWVYLHKDEMPPRREIGGVLKWNKAVVDKWIEDGSPRVTEDPAAL